MTLEEEAIQPTAASMTSSLPITSTASSRLPPLGSSALNQSFSMIRPARPPSRAASVFEEETDYVDKLIKKYTS